MPLRGGCSGQMACGRVRWRERSDADDQSATQRHCRAQAGILKGNPRQSIVVAPSLFSGARGWLAGGVRWGSELSPCQWWTVVPRWCVLAGHGRCWWLGFLTSMRRERPVARGVGTLRSSEEGPLLLRCLSCCCGCGSSRAARPHRRRVGHPRGCTRRRGRCGSRARAECVASPGPAHAQGAVASTVFTATSEKVCSYYPAGPRLPRLRVRCTR